MEIRPASNGFFDAADKRQFSKFARDCKIILLKILTPFEINT
jgi:hypothetical protein